MSESSISNELDGHEARRLKRDLRRSGYAATLGYGRGTSWTRFEKGPHVVIVTRHYTGPEWSPKPSDGYTMDRFTKPGHRDAMPAPRMLGD